MQPHHNLIVGDWVKLLFYTGHQSVGIFSSLFVVVPVIGRVYFIRIALAYVAVVLALCALGISLLRALVGLL